MIGVKPEGADGAAVHVIGGAVDTPWLRAFAQAHEQAGFDRVLVGYTSTSAEGFAVTGYAAAHTERLGYLIAHRPGFGAPTLTARAVATLDPGANGRGALDIITGGSDAEQTRGGDWPGHATRDARTDEYPGVRRRRERARRILATVMEARPSVVGEGAGLRPQAVGARRLVEFARESEVHDKRLWTPIAAAMGGAGNTTALVGTPEQVAESLLDYYDIGCTTLLIRGFDPLNDALQYGRELIPLVRAEVARRDRPAVVEA